MDCAPHDATALINAPRGKGLCVKPPLYPTSSTIVVPPPSPNTVVPPQPSVFAPFATTMMPLPTCYTDGDGVVLPLDLETQLSPFSQMLANIPRLAQISPSLSQLMADPLRETSALSPTINQMLANSPSYNRLAQLSPTLSQLLVDIDPLAATLMLPFPPQH
jgi:hypothetical protein